MTWPRSLESVSSRVAAPTTSTVSVTLPGVSCSSTRCRAPTVACTLSASAIEKPCELRGDAVPADAHGGELEGAVLVGHLGGRDAGVDAGQRHGRAGHDGAGVVADRAEDGRGVELRVRGRARAQQKQRRAKQRIVIRWRIGTCTGLRNR